MTERRFEALRRLASEYHGGEFWARDRRELREWFEELRPEPAVNALQWAALLVGGACYLHQQVRRGAGTYHAYVCQKGEARYALQSLALHRSPLEGLAAAERRIADAADEARATSRAEDAAYGQAPDAWSGGFAENH